MILFHKITGRVDDPPLQWRMEFLRETIIFLHKRMNDMKLKTTLLGKTYIFQDLKEVLAKANEEKTGDKLAGLAAETAQERVAAKVVLSAVTQQMASSSQ